MQKQSSYITIAIIVCLTIAFVTIYTNKNANRVESERKVYYFWDSIPYPVPSKPIMLKKVNWYYDTLAFNRQLDSALAKNPDTLKESVKPYTTIHKDSAFYIRITSEPLKQSNTLDSIWFAKLVRRDSLVRVFTKEYIEPDWYNTFLVGFMSAIITILVVVGVL